MRLWRWLDRDVQTAQAIVLIAWIAIVKAMIDTIVIVLKVIF